jgi:lysophospholipid acyltransferase (LPLAT)-like uncharacterized protein
VNPLREKLLLAVVPRLGYAYIRLLRLTMRLEYRNRDVLERARAAEGQYILAFWHSRFVMMPYCYPGDRLVVLSSQHRDSRMLARILARFGLDRVWGSSTKDGALGLRALLRRVRDGYDVGFTPDGPKGPRRRAKAGVVAAAKLSGLPIIPVAFSANRARRLRSWDRTLVPKLFGRGLFIYGEPIRIPRGAGEAEVERLRSLLESELDRLTDTADGEVGIPLEEARPPGTA